MFSELSISVFNMAPVRPVLTAAPELLAHKTFFVSLGITFGKTELAF
jgi:hypothetical protein